MKATNESNQRNTAAGPRRLRGVLAAIATITVLLTALAVSPGTAEASPATEAKGDAVMVLDQGDSGEANVEVYEKIVASVDPQALTCNVEGIPASCDFVLALCNTPGWECVYTPLVAELDPDLTSGESDDGLRRDAKTTYQLTSSRR